MMIVQHGTSLGLLKVFSILPLKPDWKESGSPLGYLSLDTAHSIVHFACLLFIDKSLKIKNRK